MKRTEKLPDETIVEIRRLYVMEGWSQGRLAREFGYSAGQIGRIVRGESRQKVAMPKPPPTAEEVHASAERVLAMLDNPAPSTVTTPLDPAIAKRAARYGARLDERGPALVDKILSEAQAIKDLKSRAANALKELRDEDKR